MLTIGTGPERGERPGRARQWSGGTWRPGLSCLGQWPRIVVVKDVAEITVRDLGVGKVARAAYQAASGRPCGIARFGSSVETHLVPRTLRPDVEAVPGKLSAGLGGAIASRVRAAANTPSS